jgi:hypothetical protein
MSAPALSIVVTGRNDGWGGDFNERFFATLAFNAARLGERGLAFELIFVEWNPVPGRPLLAELLAREFPALTGGVLRRFVAAPRVRGCVHPESQGRFLRVHPEKCGHPAGRRAAGSSHQCRRFSRSRSHRRDRDRPARPRHDLTGQRGTTSIRRPIEARSTGTCSRIHRCISGVPP